jgi:hypothetical protein
MTPLLERHFHVTLIELVTFEVSVVVASYKAHLIRLPALDKRGGTDGPDVRVGEGDNARSGATGEMGRRACVVEVVGGPTEPTGPVIRTFPTIVSWVLTMTREAVRERGQLALSKYRPRGSAWFLNPTTLQAVLAFAIFRVDVRGPLSGMEAGENARRRGGGSLSQEVRVKMRADRSMCKVSLHDVLLLFRLALDSVELGPLSLHVC